MQQPVARQRRRTKEWYQFEPDVHSVPAQQPRRRMVWRAHSLKEAFRAIFDGDPDPDDGPGRSNQGFTGCGVILIHLLLPTNEMERLF